MVSGLDLLVVTGAVEVAGLKIGLEEQYQLE